MDAPPAKLPRLRPRHSLCEFEPYQCDRPRYLRSRYCDAHICEMQTLRSMTGSNHAPSAATATELSVEVSPPVMPPTSSSGGDGSLETSPPAAQQPPPPPSPIIQCQYRVRRYERRCRNPVPPDGGDVHFCSEHRARVASRRDTNGTSTSTTGPATSTSAAGTTTSSANSTGDNSMISAVVSDYISLPERWVGSRRGGGQTVREKQVEAHFGHEGLAMPRGKEERGEWREDWDSDAESPASDDEDMMESTRNAGAYSLHELLINAMFHRRKLMLLYQEQMAFLRRILQHDYAVYEEVRRDHRQMRTATNTIIMRGRQAQSFRATRKFKRYSGAESLVHEKSKRIRLRSVCPEKIKPSANPQRCAYNDPTKDEKCPERVLPLCKYCPKHILHQANQCLFEPCRAERCDHPVLRSAAAEEKDSPSTSPDQFCTVHRSEESLLDFLPPDTARANLVEAISGLTAPPEPPPEAIAAAREEAAALAAAAVAASSESASPDKARSLRREDSISLQEQFDLNLLMPDVMDMPEMDTNLMEEALSVLRDPEHGAPGAAMQGGLGPAGSGSAPGPNWEDIANVMDFYPPGELWPSDLEPLNEVWQRLITSGAAMEDRRKVDDGLADLGGLEDQQEEDGEKEEDVEVECVAEELDLHALASGQIPCGSVDPQQEQIHLQELRNLQASQQIESSQTLQLQTCEHSRLDVQPVTSDDIHPPTHNAPHHHIPTHSQEASPHNVPPQAHAVSTHTLYPQSSDASPLNIPEQTHDASSHNATSTHEVSSHNVLNQTNKVSPIALQPQTHDASHQHMEPESHGKTPQVLESETIVASSQLKEQEIHGSSPCTHSKSVSETNAFQPETGDAPDRVLQSAMYDSSLPLEPPIIDGLPHPLEPQTSSSHSTVPQTSSYQMEEAYDGSSPPLQPVTPNFCCLKSLDQTSSKHIQQQQSSAITGESHGAASRNGQSLSDPDNETLDGVSDKLSSHDPIYQRQGSDVSANLISVSDGEVRTSKLSDKDSVDLPTVSE